ncbi:hypothetical protein BDY21DRAFT_349249, partial [Lineolata rhizophorae]
MPAVHALGPCPACSCPPALSLSSPTRSNLPPPSSVSSESSSALRLTKEPDALRPHRPACSAPSPWCCCCAESPTAPPTPQQRPKPARERPPSVHASQAAPLFRSTAAHHLHTLSPFPARPHDRPAASVPGRSCHRQAPRPFETCGPKRPPTPLDARLLSLSFPLPPRLCRRTAPRVQARPHRSFSSPPPSIRLPTFAPHTHIRPRTHAHTHSASRLSSLTACAYLISAAFIPWSAGLRRARSGRYFVSDFFVLIARHRSRRPPLPTCLLPPLLHAISANI